MFQFCFKGIIYQTSVSHSLRGKFSLYPENKTLTKINKCFKQKSRKSYNHPIHSVPCN